MRATGIVRRIDDLGRFVLPMELRRMLHIKERDSMEVFVDEDMIILRKYEPACLFTGTTDDLVEYGNRRVSKAAIYELAQIAGLFDEES